MKIGRLAVHYITWHYSTAFADLWRVFSNLAWFVYNVFSISFLFKRLFDPFERLREEHRPGKGLNDFFSALAVTIIMRIVGAVVRLVVILIGIITLLLTVLLGICTFLLWPFIPIVVIVLFVFSIPMII